MTADASKLIELSSAPVPAPPAASKLTRSQLLFTLDTGIDARSLVLARGIEFFIFMELRDKNKWTSFSMNPRKWAIATAEYNKRLVMECSKKGLPVPVPKNPRALVEKLGQVEAEVLKRVATGNYRCRLSDF